VPHYRVVEVCAGRLGSIWKPLGTVMTVIGPTVVARSAIEIASGPSPSFRESCS
jgi:hypothetical protein